MQDIAPGQLQKTVAETRTILSELIEPGDANYLGKAFGGAILSKIDLCAYATASKFAGTICVTASFDKVDFHMPIEVGELVTLEGRVTYAGKTSVEVTIEISSQNVMTGETRHTNTARVTMVAIREGKPSPVPRLVPSTREEKIDYLLGRHRRERVRALDAERTAAKQQVQALRDETLDDLISAKDLSALGIR